MTLSPGRRLGPYEIVSPLGRGVYEARDTRLERRVALKTLRPELLADPHARRRFEREARALSSLSHPNICTVFDVGHEDGIDFIVMEYIEGNTLAALLDRRALQEATLVRYAEEIAEALAEAHDHGVLHRDIKPQNVMVTYILARAAALRGDGDEAARWLQETIAWGFPCFPMFSTDHFLDPVRQSPRVRKVLADLELTWEGYRAALQ